MELRYINVNGYGVLVDETAAPQEGDIVCGGLGGNDIKIYSKYFADDWFKIVFAEKELNLDVQILPNWRNFEIEKLAETYLKGYVLPLTDKDKIHILNAFVDGYLANYGQYTEEDLRNAIDMARKTETIVPAGAHDPRPITTDKFTKTEIIQSFQKYPMYIEMESEIKLGYAVGTSEMRPLLITNADGKKQGIIKQIVWD